MKEEVLMVKIHKAIKEGKDHYEATRGKWKVDQRRLSNIQYVVGIENGEVVCAYEPTKWSIQESGEDKGRKYFEGKELNDSALYSKLQKSNSIMLKKFGNVQSVGYIYLSELE